jgi:hypothetical protein
MKRLFALLLLTSSFAAVAHSVAGLQPPALRLTAAEGTMTVYHGKTDSDVKTTILGVTENGKPAPAWVSAAFQQYRQAVAGELRQRYLFSSTQIVTEVNPDGSRVVNVEQTTRSSRLPESLIPVTQFTRQTYLPDGRIKANTFRNNSLPSSFSADTSPELRARLEQAYQSGWRGSLILLESCYTAQLGVTRPLIVDPKRIDPTSQDAPATLGTTQLSLLPDGRFECRMRLDGPLYGSSQRESAFESTTQFLPNGREDSAQTSSSVLLDAGTDDFSHMGRNFRVKYRVLYTTTSTLGRDPNSP